MEKLESNLSNLSIGSQNDENDEKWGWPLRELYRQGLSFYKGKNIFLEKIEPEKIMVLSFDLI